MKTALVTGAASGIGRATARRLASDGWRVYATDVDADGLADLDCCLTDSMDVTDDAAVERVRSRIETEAGGLDCLVANAGFAQLGPLADLSGDHVESQLAVNVAGTHRSITSLLPLLTVRDGTAVVVSSTHGHVTTPGMGAYAASKHALEGLAETLHMEVADRSVDVAVVEPAWVETAFTDQSRQTLADLDPSGDHADVYAAMREGSLLDGGPLAVTPERVAARIHAIATADDPAFRHPVGVPARLVLATRWLPYPVQHVGQRAAIRLFAAVHRLRGGR